MAAVSASLEQNAGAILVLTTSENTIRLVSKYCPVYPIMEKWTRIKAIKEEFEGLSI
ncbi:hypothetical protein BU16DRAFT_554070 [Lophium mytilinum]|uniref:Pyruvate kinase C-terminal domain-containing protein n=1 Tax=Lophium mytilinum TaxID=390894 RepID=A0A6A6REX8_9PEZI|nr:hypothetical protein BU16DRAFT_554070 [Lophium mytilinum]